MTELADPAAAGQAARSGTTGLTFGINEQYAKIRIQTGMKRTFEKVRILITRIAAITIFLFICVSTSYWEEANEVVSFALFLIGIILVAIGSLGRMWCSLYIAGYKDMELITEGPYSLTRNPLYLFSLVGVLGIGFATETFTIAIILLLLFLAYYPFVIRGEEERLRSLFGESYIRYQDSVPALFPKTFKAKEPKTYSVNPKVYRKHIFSALWFVWIVGILEVVEGLREIGILGSWFTLP